MMFKFSALATLVCTVAAVSEAVFGRGIPYRYRRSVPVYKRALQVETLDGSPVDPLIVDFLDQFEYMRNEADNAVVGTSQYSSIMSEYSAVSSTLSFYMQGYATFVTTTPTSTAVPTPTPTSETPAEGGEDGTEGEDGGAGTEEDEPLPETETEPKPTAEVPSPTPTAAPTPTTTSSKGPVIVTVIPQTNTAVVVIASDGTTNTITRTATASRTKETVTVTKSVSDEAIPRSVTTSVKPGQTAVAANSEAGDVPRNSARSVIASVREGLWLVPAGIMLMSVL